MQRFKGLSNFPRNLGLDFGQYTGEQPEVSLNDGNSAKAETRKELKL